MYCLPHDSHFHDRIDRSYTVYTRTVFSYHQRWIAYCSMPRPHPLLYSVAAHSTIDRINTLSTSTLLAVPSSCRNNFTSCLFLVVVFCRLSLGTPCTKYGTCAKPTVGREGFAQPEGPTPRLLKVRVPFPGTFRKWMKNVKVSLDCNL